MAKPTKPTKPTPKSEPVIASEKKSRRGGAVLISKTPAELKDLIGADTPIPVSKKALYAIVVKAKADEALAEAGLD